MNKSKAAIFNKKPIVTFGKKEIKVLKKYTSKNPKNRFRICLHTNQSHLTQEMLICTKGFSYIRPHKHPRNISESYHVLEGALNVYILNNKGKIVNVVKLSAQSENLNHKIIFTSFIPFLPPYDPSYEMDSLSRSYNWTI